MFDDIAAISTPFGTAGISVIRVSGQHSIEKVNKTFKGPNLTKVKTHTIHYGHILNSSGEVIDEVMISVFIGPKSFTAENTVEISTHGGILVTDLVLERILELDIRLANPGEFSERAYLNGRIDLVEAESIMDVIHAKSESALKIANLGLEKRTSKLVTDLRDKLLAIIANIEVNIDYPEYDEAEEVTNNFVYEQTKLLIADMKYLLSKSSQTRLIREGIKTAIIGRPNVGKSSLLNTLIDEDKAIVTNIAGTTRDLVDAHINIGGITLNLVDTAGIRETKDLVEQIGVLKSKEVISKAELILLVLDQSEALTKEDLELLELTKEKPRIIILNKSDLENKLKDIEGIKISTITYEGIEVLEHAILDKLKLGNLSESDFNYLSNVRHINKVKEALNALEQVLVSIDLMMPVDILVTDLTTAWNLLGDILGKNSGTELLDELFSKFCLGK